MPDPHKAVMRLVEEDEEVWEISYVKGLEQRCDDLEEVAAALAAALRANVPDPYPEAAAGQALAAYDALVIDGDGS